MKAVLHPTVLVALDAFGAEVRDRFDPSLHDGQALLCWLEGGEASALGAALEATLEQLLRAGRRASEHREQRLDLWAFAAWDADLPGAVAAMTRVVGERYAALFPANRPPEQRTACLHLVVQVPPMGPSDGCRRALEALARLDAAADTLPYPLLSRIWLVSPHTEAGTLSHDGVVATAASFALAALGSALRDHDEIATRLAHPRPGEGRYGFVSLASLDLPEARLLQYAAVRATWDGLATLVRRVSRPSADPDAARQATAGLEVEALTAPFVEGDAARRARTAASHLSGGDEGLPADIRVRPLDEPPDIEARYGALLAPATKSRPPTSRDRTVLDEVGAALDRAESEASERVARGLDAVFEAKLGRDSGLRRLADVEQGLRHQLAGLEDAAKSDVEPSDGDAPDPDPLRAELDATLAALPRRSMLWAVSLAMGLAFGTLATMAALAYLVTDPPAAATAASSAPVVAAPASGPGIVWVEVIPWALGLLTGGGATAGWLWFVGTRTRSDVEVLLRRRKEAIVSLRLRGGGGAPGRQAEAQLRLRRQRLRRSAQVALSGALDQLSAARRTLLDRRDAARQALVDMGVVPSDDAASDDLGRVLGEPELLHDTLVPAPVLARWIASCRKRVDPEVWADALVDGTWPAGGLRADVPCADDLGELAAEQVSPLRERYLLDDPEAAEAAGRTVRAFLARIAAALARPCEPRDAHDPAPGVRAGEIFAVGPIAGRDALSGALLTSPWPMAQLWSPRAAARLLFLRTWEGYTLAQIARGAGGAR